MKTSELTGAALDWAVAKCKGVHVQVTKTSANNIVVVDNKGRHVTYSRTWQQGGPIIEREKIELVYKEDEYVREVRDMFWYAWQPHPDPDHNGYEMKGDTPLIAAMRCYVANKLGEDVDIPEELK